VCDPAHLSTTCSDLASQLRKRDSLGNAAIGTVIGGSIVAIAGAIYLPLAVLSGKSSSSDSKASQSALVPRVIPAVSDTFRGAFIVGQF
jgi:hypothetical protein